MRLVDDVCGLFVRQSIDLRDESNTPRDTSQEREANVSVSRTVDSRRRYACDKAMSMECAEGAQAARLQSVPWHAKGPRRNSTLSVPYFSRSALTAGGPPALLQPVPLMLQCRKRLDFPVTCNKFPIRKEEPEHQQKNTFRKFES
jgi:hypothetical protein